MMIFAFVLIAIAFLVAGVMISRLGSRQKNEAVADLARERQALHTPNIFELVDQEVRDSGITDLPGAENVDPTVLLKVWKRDRAGCDEGTGRFTIASGVKPDDATENDVSFGCA